MANKLQQIRDLSLETSKEITSTPEKWLEIEKKRGAIYWRRAI